MVLAINNLTGFGGATGSSYLYDIITEFGLTSNLNFCLDAADSRSYGGSGQTWTDISGSGNSFVLGTTTGVNTNDPTFVGTTGAPTDGTYFSMDGGDYFVESASHTFSDNWHKNNGAFTLVFIIYFGNVSSDQILFNTYDTSNGDGVLFFIDNVAGEFALEHSITNTTSEVVSMGVNGVATTWSFVGIDFNEAGPSMNFRCNAGTSTPTVAASTNTTTPSAANSICTGDAALAPMSAGSRIIAVAGWSTAIGSTAISKIYDAIKTRRITSIP